MKRNIAVSLFCIVILASLSLVLSGCGSGSKPAGGPTSQEVQSHFRVMANPVNGWQRIAVKEGDVSVEFPVDSSMMETIGEATGKSPQVFSLSGNITNKSINLRFSYSKIPDEWAQLPETGQLQEIVNSLKENEINVSGAGPVSGMADVFQIIADKENGGQLFVMRIAFRNGFIYRAIATSTTGFHDDPAIAQFINSFECGS